MKCLFNRLCNHLFIKICIGNGDKQIEGHTMVDRRLDCLSFSAKLGRYCGQTFCHIDQKVLHICNICCLAADTSSGASSASCCFLTLITKHLIIHLSPPYPLAFSNCFSDGKTTVKSILNSSCPNTACGFFAGIISVSPA